CQIAFLSFALSWLCFFFFFFSSTRRHTRFSRDWSSDVCSSDLADIDAEIEAIRNEPAPTPTTVGTIIQSGHSESIAAVAERESRSEERRVGKECRSRGSPYHEKKKR